MLIHMNIVYNTIIVHAMSSMYSTSNTMIFTHKASEMVTY